MGLRQISCSKKNPSVFYPCAKWYPFKFRGWIIQWSGGKICVHLCHLWETKIIIRGGRNDLSVGKDITDPSISPWSGEDWFVRILRVLGNCINPCQSTYSASSQTASPSLGETGEGSEMSSVVVVKLPTPLSPSEVGRTSLSVSWESYWRFH